MDEYDLHSGDGMAEEKSERLKTKSIGTPKERKDRLVRRVSVIQVAQY